MEGNTIIIVAVAAAVFMGVIAALSILSGLGIAGINMGLLTA